MAAKEENVSDLLGRVMARAPETNATPASQPKEYDTVSMVRWGSGDQNWRLQGIYAETSVTTNFGKVPAQLIRLGDRVRTRSGLYLPVRDIQEYILDAEYLERHPEALPVLIPVGAIDGRLPTQDVMLSPELLVTLDARRTKPEMTLARELRNSCPAVDTTLGMVAYYQFGLDRPAEIYCEGIWANSAVKS